MNRAESDTPRPIRILHLAKKQLSRRFWSPAFIERLRALGEVSIHEDTGDWSDEQVAAACREHDVVIVGWGARRMPDSLATDPGRLRYICNLSGETRPFVSRKFIESGMLVSNWGDLPALHVAEGALALLLASLKLLIPQHEAIRDGGWAAPVREWRASVNGLRLGVFGLGVIGRAFTDQVRPLKPTLIGLDPYLQDWPADIEQVDSLEALFGTADAVVITAALTDETRASVTKRHFASLPDGGIVINVGRGAIIDQEALFAELETGRLRAGLDVLDSDGKDYVEPGHPARQWPNLILTGHMIAENRWNQTLRGGDGLRANHKVCLTNLERFSTGQPLLNLFDLNRYDRST